MVGVVEVDLFVVNLDVFVVCCVLCFVNDDIVVVFVLIWCNVVDFDMYVVVL